LLVIPKYLKINNSFLSISLIKKNIVETKKIKGSISKITDGALSRDKKTG